MIEARPKLEDNLEEWQRRSELLRASAAGHHHKVAKLLKGGDARFADARGTSPLMWAACHGHDKAVETLIPHSDPDHVDQLGRSAIGFAAKGRSRKVVELLAGACDVDKWREVGGPHGGCGAVHFAAMGYGCDCVDLLAAKGGADLRNDRGETPLMLAASYGRAETIQTLLRQGADAGLADKMGFTPLMRAAQLTPSPPSAKSCRSRGKGGDSYRGSGTAPSLASAGSCCRGH